MLSPDWAAGYNRRMSSQSLTRPAVGRQRTPHRFTVDEYVQMIDFGILDKYDRVELIRGEIIEKMTIGDPHATCVRRLNWLLTTRAGKHALLSIQSPVRLADSMPEPDVAVLKPRDDFYLSGTPRSADVLLLIEVADSTLEFDRDVKRELYAENGITEYWIVDLNDGAVEVHRQPRPDGTYADVQTKRRGEQLDVAALPGITLAVSEIL